MPHLGSLVVACHCFLFLIFFLHDLYFKFIFVCAEPLLLCAFLGCGRGYVLVAVRWFLIAMASVLQSMGSRVHGRQWLWHTGLSCLTACGICWTRD